MAAILGNHAHLSFFLLLISSSLLFLGMFFYCLKDQE
jgi:hypothetical protein